MRVSYKRILLILGLVTLAFTAYDIHWVLSPEFDPNRHVPGLLPIVFGAFMGIVRAIEKHDQVPA